MMLKFRGIKCVEEVDEWMRFPYVKSGYRCHKHYGNIRACIGSMFNARHNQWFNIWSMVMSLMCGVSLWIIYGFVIPPTSGDLLIPLSAMLVGQMIHHPFSIAYHTFMPLSASTYNMLKKLDMSTILLLNTCASLGLSWYTFGRYGSIVCVSVSGVCALLGIYFIMTNLATGSGSFHKRSLVLGVIAMTALPYYVAVLYAGFNPPSSNMIGAILTIVCHSSAAALYGTHTPERYVQKRFDNLGYSHHLMHVLVMVVYNYGYYYIHQQHKYRL